MTPPTVPRLAIVTVSFGSEGVLPSILGSIPAAVTEPYRLVLVDNKPVEGSPVPGIAQTAGADYLPLDNPGYGGAANRAVHLLDDSIEWVLVANPDVVFAEQAIDRLLAAADTDEQIGSVGPAILTPDGEVYPSARAVPSLRTGVGHALLGGVWPGNPWTRRYRCSEGSDVRTRDAGWLSGACVLVRRRVFEELGGFDTGYFMYFEDVDLGYRIGKAGYRNVYEPGAVVTHIGAHSTGGDASAGMLRAHHASARRFIDRKYHGAIMWPVRAVLHVGLEVREGLLVRRGARR